MTSEQNLNNLAKPSWEWTENDLLSMKKAQTQESLHLDFKESAALSKDEKKKAELSKDVSAFANSDGGEIIYGVSETGKRPPRFGDFDGGIDSSIFPPEWLENIINSRIQPRISGVRITPIELKTPHPGRFIYVVHIPVSVNAPHQASDKRYYKRFNFQSVPMEDYEIRDVHNRQYKPELHILCEVLKAHFASHRNFRAWLFSMGFVTSGPVLISSFQLRVWLVNPSLIVAKRPQIILSFDNLSIKKCEGFALRIDDIRDGKPSLQWTGSEGIIYPNSTVKIMDIELSVTDLKKHCIVNTEVCAENLLTLTHKYEFNSSYLSIANSQYADGSRVRVSLDTIENMWKK